MADLVKFVSKSELDGKREKRREARETILRKAKNNYEKKERELEERKQRGEDVWMLPSVNRRFSGSSSEEEHLRKKKHKSGKKKKKKKKKHKSDSEEDEWVEKDAGTSVQEAAEIKSSASTQRDSWMLFPMPSKNQPKEIQLETENETVQAQSNTESDNKVENTSSELIGQHPRELNPYWKEGGSGLPSAKTNDKGLPSGNRAWFKRAYERAKQQAEEEGRSLEDVAAERWGSLEKLKALANGDEDKRNNPKDKSKGRDRRQGECSESKKDSPRSRENRKDYKERAEDPSHRRERHNQRDMGTFRKPIEAQRDTLKKLLRPPDEEGEASTSKSSTWEKKYDSYRNREASTKTASGRWRKRQAEDQTLTKETPKPTKHGEDIERRLHESSDSGSSSEENEVENREGSDLGPDNEEKALMTKRITEADLNALGAKRLKAELIGNEELAKELDAKLEKLRNIKEKQEKAGDVSSKVQEDDENVVVLTRTDRAGNVVPVEIQARRKDKGKTRKRHKNVSTHDAEGKRSRYFCDDDDHDLKSLVAREKMSTAEDQNATYARLAHKLGGQFELDDKFVSAAASKYTPEELEEKKRQKAIREHQRLAAQMENCKYCLDSRELAKHLIIAIGLQVYLALPSIQSLCDGHCLLFPMMHHTAGTIVDEDVWSEIQIFKKGLTKMFEEMGKDVVFMEMNRNLNNKRHMMIECVPIDKEVGDLAPIYFKKAILESDTEWAQNNKLIDTRKKDLRSSVPKGLPYFSVEFGLDGGFAHVIENEELVPAYFGKEIVGGMLELEPFIWKKPRKENFQIQKKKVLEFAEWWKPFDWTRRIQKK